MRNYHLLKKELHVVSAPCWNTAANISLPRTEQPASSPPCTCDSHPTCSVFTAVLSANFSFDEQTEVEAEEEQQATEKMRNSVSVFLKHRDINNCMKTHMAMLPTELSQNTNSHPHSHNDKMHLAVLPAELSQNSEQPTHTLTTIRWIWQCYQQYYHKTLTATHAPTTIRWIWQCYQQKYHLQNTNSHPHSHNELPSHPDLSSHSSNIISCSVF